MQNYENFLIYRQKLKYDENTNDTVCYYTLHNIMMYQIVRIQQLKFFFNVDNLSYHKTTPINWKLFL